MIYFSFYFFQHIPSGSEVYIRGRPILWFFTTDTDLLEDQKKPIPINLKTF